jgi:hypothetical protein
MIKKIVNRIRTFSLIFKLFKTEPNDYSFGHKVRRILKKYQEGKEIKEEDIFKEKPKT